MRRERGGALTLMLTSEYENLSARRLCSLRRIERMERYLARIDDAVWLMKEMDDFDPQVREALRWTYLRVRGTLR